MLTYLAQFHSSLAKPFSRVWSRGFTIIEMLVVVAVISIITTVMLFNQNKFNSSTLLRSLAYSAALTVRQAQLYGSSVRGFSSGGTTKFASGYGSNVSSANLSKFYLFADVDGDNIFDLGEGVSTSTLGTGYTISRFCAIVSSSIMSCYPSGVGGGSDITSLTMYFKRPNSDATFYTSVSGETYIAGFIKIKSTANNDFRVIKITNTGQITVCPLNAEPPASTC